MEDIKEKSDSEIAALAVRSKSKELLITGLDSLFSSNAIYDYRDIISALVLYYDAAKRLGLDADAFFLMYSEVNPMSTKDMRNFINRSSEQKTIEIGGYKVIDTPEFQYIFRF